MEYRILGKTGLSVSALGLGCAALGGVYGELEEADAIRTLPSEFREVLLLRERDGLAYRQIATATGVPLGTVMSRLARARSYIQRRVVESDERERGHC